jgi:hypothetical protein
MKLGSAISVCPWLLAIQSALVLAQPVAADPSGEADAFDDVGSMPPEPPVPSREARRRELRHHLFIPSDLVIDPFSTTYVRMRAGAGHASATGPDFNPQGEPEGTRDYSQAAVQQTLELQIAPLEWFALRVSGDAFIFSGIDAPSVIATGAVVQLGFAGGVTFTLPGTDWLRPGLVFDITHGPAYALTVLEALEVSIAESRIATGDALESGDITTLRPGVSAAVALDRALGLVIAAQYVSEIGEDDIGFSREDDAYSLGAALDFDFHARSAVPVGLLAALRWVDGWTGSEDADVQVDGGVFYTGRDDLVLGATLGVRDFPQAGGFDTTAVLGSFELRYYW